MESPVQGPDTASVTVAAPPATPAPTVNEVKRRLHFRPRVEGGVAVVLLWSAYNLGSGIISALAASNPTADDIDVYLSQILLPLIALPALILMIWRSSIWSAALLVALMLGDAALYITSGSWALVAGHIVLAGLIAQSIPVLLASRRAMGTRSEPAPDVKAYVDWYEWSLSQVSSAPEAAHAAAGAAIEAQRHGIDPVAAARQGQPTLAIPAADADRRQLAEWVSWARRQPGIPHGDAYTAAAAAIGRLRQGAGVAEAAAAGLRSVRFPTWKKVNLGLVVAACFIAFLFPAGQTGYIVINGNFPLSTAAISLLVLGASWTAAVLVAVSYANRVPFLWWVFPPALFIGGYVLLTVACLDCTWSHK
jgi:hypothetical protein